MHRGAVAVEYPRSEQNRDDPAVSIAGLLPLAEINAIVEDSRIGLETACLHGFDREPDPVKDEQNMEDDNCEAEIPC